MANSLFDPEDYEDRVLKIERQPFGRVAIANSDAGGDAYAHLAIDAAARAVRELLQAMRELLQATARARRSLPRIKAFTKPPAP